MKRIYLIVVFLLGLIINLVGQETSFKPHYYKEARIKTTDSVLIKVSKLYVLEQDISFTFPSTLQEKRVPIERISYIKYKNGSYYANGALIGGLFSGLVGVFYSRVTHDDYSFTDNSTFKVVGFTLGGILIGGLIGNAIPKWEIYFPNKQQISSITPDIFIGQNAIGIKLAISIIPR